MKTFLNEVQSTLIERQKKSRIRIIRIFILSIIGIIILIAGWHFSHGKIEIVTYPHRDVTIYLDDKLSDNFKEIKPGVFQSSSLFWGEYEIKIKKEHFQPATISTFVGLASTDTHFVSLKPEFGYGVLNISSEPIGVNIYFDGKYIGTAPLNIDAIKFDKYRLVAKMSQYFDMNKEVIINRDSTKIKLTMKPFNPNTFFINTAWVNPNRNNWVILVVNIHPTDGTFSVRMWDGLSAEPENFIGEQFISYSDALDSLIELTWNKQGYYTDTQKIRPMFDGSLRITGRRIFANASVKEYDEIYLPYHTIKSDRYYNRAGKQVR